MSIENWIETAKIPPKFHTQLLFYAGKEGVLIGAFYRHSHKFIDSNGNKFYKDDVSHWSHITKPNNKQGE